MFYRSLAAALLFAVSFAKAQETPVEIDVHLLEANASVAEPSRTVIGEKELEQRKGQSAADLLREVPGLQVFSSGGAGQPASVLIRGASSQETLVMIDGLEVNDPLNPSRGYDFSQLSLESLERVEIYRGPQTVRFGSGAVGGVINFVTRKGEGPPVTSALIEAGAYQTNKEMLQMSGRKNQLSYSFGATAFSTEGFSAADAREGATEADGQQLQSLSSRVGWAFDSNNEVEVSIRSTHSKMDLDRSGGPLGDDPNYAGEMNQLVTAAKYRRLSFEGKLDSLLSFSWGEFRRSDRNDPDATSTTLSWDHFLSETRKVEFNNEYFFKEKESLRWGIQYQDEGGGSTSSYNGTVTEFSRKYQSIFGTSLIYSNKSQAFFYETGVREDQDLQFGSITTASVELGYHFQSEITLRGSAASGFKSPSLYQLYSSYGDQNLEAEKVQSYEISAEKKWESKTSLILTYFKNQYRHLIDFNTTTSKYENIGQAWAKGVELQFLAPLFEELSLRISYDSLLSRDQSIGLELLRRPQNAGSAELIWEKQKWEWNIRYRYVGSREDLDAVSFARTTMPAYQVVDLSSSYRLSKNFKAFARLENALNEKYEEVSGYGTSDAALYMGLAGQW